MNIPSKYEEPLKKCRVLYMGTSIFTKTDPAFNEKNINLSVLQETIEQRYPVDGSNFSKGIETWLSIFPSGLQMEHSSSKEASVNALFYYPIKCLVYCGALRFVTNKEHDKAHKFVPLDSNTADSQHNLKNPPLFVVLLKGVDSRTKESIIECSVFVVGMKKTAMRLVECCQEAFSAKTMSIYDFFLRYGNIPVVYCAKNELNSNTNNSNRQQQPDARISVKQFDSTGYYYATESTPIDLWQLFESSSSNNNNHSNFNNSTSNPSSNVKWLTDKNELLNYNKTSNYDVRGLLYNDELAGIEDQSQHQQQQQPPPLIRQERTPSPIIFEKYIKKKQPQVIIKEIYVTEQAPPPMKIIENLQKKSQHQTPPITYKPTNSSQFTEHHVHVHQPMLHQHQLGQQPRIMNRVCQNHLNQANTNSRPIYGGVPTCQKNLNHIRQGGAVQHEQKEKHVCQKKSIE